MERRLKMSKYLISLTPMGSFYFGGERSFPLAGEKQNEFASYIVQSNLFPQQTALLGMLRFWILKNHPEAFSLEKNQIIDSTKATDVIGSRGFSTSNSEKADFKLINSISYCFLQKWENETSWEAILPTPMDYGLTVDFNKEETAIYNAVKKQLPQITYASKKKDFSSKEGLIRGYVGSEGRYIKEKDIFLKDQRIGINRDIKTGKTEEDALYKQVCYRLAKGYSFAFYAEMNDWNYPQESQIVELGGDSSKFALTCTRLESEQSAPVYNERLAKPLLAKDGYQSLTLLSDTKLDNEVVTKKTLFSISETVPFKFLDLATKKETKYDRSTNDKSNRYSLFKRGSVFYFENGDMLSDFIDQINKEKNFKQIGYNNYQIN